MNRRAAILLVLTLVAVAGCTASSRTVRTIEGTWFVTQATLAGEPLPVSSFDSAKLHLDGGRYEFQNDRGDYVVLSGTSPAALDIHGRDGPNAGKTILAIYALKENILTIAYDLSGTTRPKAFESAVGTRVFLVTYRRS